MNFYTSDLHFFHKNICKLTDRHLVTCQEDHTEWLINLWNKQVKKGDCVYVLGDVSFGNINITENVLTKLNGNIIVIKGNHDKERDLNHFKLDQLLVDFHDYLEIRIQGVKTCMSHYPMVSWNGSHRGSYMLHGHCVDNETELLTTEGWKKYGEFKLGDTVYSYNSESDLCEKTIIDEIISTNYTGKVFKHTGKSINFRVTEGHTLVYWYNGKYYEKRIENIHKSIPIRLITSANGQNKGTNLTLDELKLFICIASDGSLKEETNLCRIRVKKKHKIAYIESLLNKLNIEFNVYSYEDNSMSFNFYIPTRLLNWNFKGLDKKLLLANREECEGIIEAYSHADGHKQKNGVIIYSQKENEIDLLQQVFVTNGFMATKYSRNHGFGNNLQYQLSVTRNNRQSMRCGEMEVSEVIDEHFWCIKTKNRSFFIRRNGKVSITGNCHGNYTPDVGKILDVGLDSSYNIFGEYKLLTEQDIVNYMKTRSIHNIDHHKENND